MISCILTDFVGLFIAESLLSGFEQLFGLCLGSAAAAGGSKIFCAKHRSAPPAAAQFRLRRNILPPPAAVADLPRSTQKLPKPNAANIQTTVCMFAAINIKISSEFLDHLIIFKEIVSEPLIKLYGARVFELDFEPYTLDVVALTVFKEVEKFRA